MRRPLAGLALSRIARAAAAQTPSFAPEIVALEATTSNPKMSFEGRSR